MEVQESHEPEQVSTQSESPAVAAAPVTVNSKSDAAANPNANTADAQDASTPSTTAPQPSDPPLSKNQLKKRRRFEKATAISKRRKEQNRHIKRIKAQNAGRDLDAERQIQLRNEQSGQGWKYREDKWKKIMQDADIDNSFRVCFDCSFDGLMTYKETNSLSLQLRHAYAQNRRAKMPVYIDVCSLKEGGDTRNHMKKVAGFPESWVGRAFRCHEAGLEEVYGCGSGGVKNDDSSNNANNKGDAKEKESAVKDVDTEKTTIDNANDNNESIESNSNNTQETLTTLPPNHKLVYLTGDSANTLTTLDNNTTYIIGGIVDRNRHKLVAANRAESLGIPTARLPLEENCNFNGSTRILTCNHVFDLLLKFREGGCKDWKEAILSVLPGRKGLEDVTADGKGEHGSEVKVDEEKDGEIVEEKEKCEIKCDEEKIANVSAEHASEDKS